MTHLLMDNVEDIFDSIFNCDDDDDDDDDDIDDDDNKR